MTAATSSALLPIYAPPEDIEITHGEGVWLHTRDGRRLLDFYSGIGVNAFGHAHPHLVAALREQAGRVWHLANTYRIPGQRELAARWTAATFADRVFFCNSGAEAWEAGLKVVRHHFHHRQQPHRNRLIVLENCFHGRTLAGISAAGRPKMTDGFGPLLDGFDQVPAGDLAAVEAAIGPATAAIHVEPVLGEGGVAPLPAEYLRGLRALCDRHGLLLYLDEIQCGAGRTGRLLAAEWAGIRPDVVCMAKAVGGGFPLGLLLMTEDAARGMTVGHHGSTYGGNPLAMAVGHAVLDLLLADGFLEAVVATGASLRRRLEDLAAAWPGIIQGVRGLGLMLGLRLVDGVDNLDFVARLRGEGVLTVGASDNVVRLLPPLIITDTEIDLAVGAMERVAARLSPSAAAPAPAPGAAAATPAEVVRA